MITFKGLGIRTRRTYKCKQKCLIKTLALLGPGNCQGETRRLIAIFTYG